VSFVRDLRRILLWGALATLSVGIVLWIGLLDRLSIGSTVPIWRRVFLSRSGDVAGSRVHVPLAYAVIPQERGLRVVYRFPALNRAQATFFLQVQRFKDSSTLVRPVKTTAKCDSVPDACTTWFADPPNNRLPCTEGWLGASANVEFPRFRGGLAAWDSSCTQHDPFVGHG
jgi:hypothetical protein